MRPAAGEQHAMRYAHLRYRSRAMRRLEARAIAVIEDWLKRCRNPYVAFSGGKDSTVMLDLCRRVEPNLPALFVHDDFIPDETWDYVRSVDNVVCIAGRTRHTDWFTSWDYDEPPPHLPDGVKWIQAPPGVGAREEYERISGVDGKAVGLRAEENSYRRVHIASKGKLFFNQGRGIWQCYPIANWRLPDVWAYIQGRKLPYNRAYDRMTEVGIPPEHQRVGPIVCERAVQYGQLSRIRLCWPDLFNRFVEKYPEARMYG